MTAFRKRPVVINAIQYDGTWESVADWLTAQAHLAIDPRQPAGESCSMANGVLTIQTLEGDMRADIGDWIICGVKNELYPCKPDIFEVTYELAAEGLDAHP